MHLPRLSLLRLMIAIAFLAAMFAIFRILWLPSRVSAFFSMVVFILLAATLGALLKRGASWLGFALFGWGWLITSYLSLAMGYWNSSMDRNPIPMPIVSIWLAEFPRFVPGLGASQPVAPQQIAVIPMGDEPLPPSEPIVVIPNCKGGVSLVKYEHVQICHLWMSLFAACIGGFLARLLDPGKSRTAS